MNDAVGGQASSSLLSQVQHGATRALPGRVTVITIGANDFESSSTLSGPGCSLREGLACYQPVLANLQANMDALLTTLVAGGNGNGPVVVTGYWNVFLDGDVGAAMGAAYVRDSDALTRAVNAALKDVTQRHGMVYVDLYKPFKQQHDGDDTALLAADGDHPSAAGHALIATLIRTALLATHR